VEITGAQVQYTPFIWVTALEATSTTKRPSCRMGESFSAPMSTREVIFARFSVDGIPWANILMLKGSVVPSSAVELPTMSFYDGGLGTLDIVWRPSTFSMP
jgi:hypothetical protein